MSKDLIIYTDPLGPGRCAMPVYALNDDQNWNLKFSDGQTFYDPTGVTLAIGYIKGLGNLTYGSAFRFVDRMNNQHVGSVVVAAGVPGTLTFDENPIGIEGDFGAWLLRGRIPPSGTVRRVYVKNGGSAISTAPAVRFSGGVTGVSGKGATATVSVSAGAVTNSFVITNPGYGYSSTPVPEVIITGDGTGATATVTTITGGQIVVISLGRGGSGYTTATVTIRDPEASGTAAVGGTSTVSAVTVNNVGRGYTSAPTVGFSGGGGASAAATTALAISTWGLLGLTLTGAGADFTDNPTVTFTGGTGSGAAGVAVITPKGVPTRINITNPGYIIAGAGAAPSYFSLIVSGGGGTGLSGGAYISLSDDGTYYYISSIFFTPGSGFTSAPTVTISVSWGTAVVTPTFTASISAGEVTSIALTNPGTGYGATAPTIGFTGGGGSGATATAQLIGSPISPVITMTNNGSGYSSPPLVAFSGGGGTGAAGVAVVALGITSITLTQGGFAYSTLPAISLVPDNGAMLSAAGVESHSIPFLQDINPASSGGAISLTPFTNGRRDASGNLVYDDGLLIVRPRYVQQPTLTRQSDGLTWAGYFAPINTFVTALLAYQSAVSLDFEVWGGGRLLLQTKLRVLKA